MSDIEQMAEKLFRAEHGERCSPLYPSRQPSLSDLWPCDREKYYRMAEEAIKRTTVYSHD